MDVACSTNSFTNETLEQALRHIAELEFPKVDLVIRDAGSHIVTKDVVDDQSAIIHRIRQGPTIGIAALTLESEQTGAPFETLLDSLAHLAKQLSAGVVIIPAAPVGTPFEDEVARLKRLTKMSLLHGPVLAVATRTGTLAEDPAVAVKLCEAVDGLGLALDPSHFLSGPNQGRSYDACFPFVRHAHLRDSGRRGDQLQLKVGRGEIEYGKIVTSLKRFQFRGSLTVDIQDRLATPDMDVEAEVRKLRLLLESLL